MLCYTHLFSLLATVASTAVAHPTKVKPSPHLYDENIAARVWRTASRGAPEVGGVGWPMYTHGAYNNTRILQNNPDHKPGTYVNTSASGWTAGFFSNILWQLYHRKKNLLPHSPSSPHEPSLEEWLVVSQAWTDPLITNQNLNSTHDIGFLAYPFESALHLTNSTNYLPILTQMSTNLASRYIPSAGVLRSWDNKNSSFSQNASHSDSVLVIIDNMMNLPLLARSASTYSGNKTLLEIAISHADQTMKHHIREDGSTYHVCDYSGTTGDLYLCRTAQGLADESTWARGQAWAVYGFAEMYDLTGKEEYLETAIKVAEWFLEHLPDDGVPFWDFSVVDLQAGVTPRDTSAATITASGLILLQGAVERRGGGRKCGRDYREAGVKLLRDTLDMALAGKISFAQLGRQDNPVAELGAVTDLRTPADTAVSKGFEAVLMHATANNNPHSGDDHSYDHGLVYGDYYLIEAGNRLLEWRQKWTSD